MILIGKETELPQKHKETITIVGVINGVLYCSKSLIDEDNDFWDSYYQTFGFHSISEIRVGDSEENIVKQKGKYIKTKEYFHDLFREDGPHPLPVIVRCAVDNEYEVQYEIEVTGDFDPKKLQLIKSDYEFNGMPYFILTEYIMYDGVKYDMSSDSYDTIDDCYGDEYADEFEVDKLYD